MRSMPSFRGLALLLLLIACPAAAEPGRPGQWTRIGPDGGTAYSVAAAPSLPSRVYAGLIGVFKSADTGSHWTFAGNGLGGEVVPTDLAVDPLRPDRVWAASPDGLFRTIDSGASWERRDAGITGPDGQVPAGIAKVVIHPRKPATVWAAVSAGGLFRTTNGGASWQLLTDGPAEVTALLADPLHPGTLWAGTAGHGLFHSLDGGDTWTAVRGGGAGLPADLSVTAMALDPLNPRVLVLTPAAGPLLFRSVDGGASWAAGGKGLPDDVVQALAIDPIAPGSPDVYAATLLHGIFRSRNGGRTWASAGPATAHRMAFALAATRSALFAATDAGVLVSTDHGTTWRSGRGLSASSVTGVAVSTQDPPRLYAADGSVLVTTNGGASWQSLGPKGDAAVSGPIELAPGQQDTVYAGVLGGIARSTDGGLHWRIAPLPFLCVTPEILLIDPARPATLYTGGDFSSAGCGQAPDACLTFKSTDAGASWSCIATNEVRSPVLGIDPFHPSHLFAEGLHGLYRSTDRGATWSLWSPGLLAGRLAFDPRHEGLLYATLPGGVGRSTDGGATWQLSAAGLPDGVLIAVAVDPVLPSTLYAATSREVFRSTDSGATWSPAGTGLEGAVLNSLRIDPGDPSVLYVTTFDSGVMRLEQE